MEKNFAIEYNCGTDRSTIILVKAKTKEEALQRLIEKIVIRIEEQ